MTESEITGKSERNRLIEEIQTLVRSREATEKVLESKTSTIQALESELNSQSASQSPLLESMQQQIRESNHEISDLTQSVESLQLALLKKEEDHKNILKDKDDELKQLKAIIAAKEEEISDLNDEWKAVNSTAPKLEKKISDGGSKLNDNLPGNANQQFSADDSDSIERKSLDNGPWDNLGKGLFFDRHNSLNKRRSSAGTASNSSSSNVVNNTTLGEKGGDCSVISGTVSYQLPADQSPFREETLLSPGKSGGKKTNNSSVDKSPMGSNRRNSYTGIHVPFYLGTDDLARVGTLLVATVRGYLTRRRVRDTIKNLSRVFFCTLKSTQGLNLKEKQSNMATTW